MRPGREHVTLLCLIGKEMVEIIMSEMSAQGCTRLRRWEGEGLHGVAPEQGVGRRPFAELLLLYNHAQAPGPTMGRASLQFTKNKDRDKAWTWQALH